MQQYCACAGKAKIPLEIYLRCHSYGCHSAQACAGGQTTEFGVWAYATLGRGDPLLFEAVAAQSNRLAEGTPQALSSVLVVSRVLQVCCSLLPLPQKVQGRYDRQLHTQ
jgi:hypothetical protein